MMTKNKVETTRVIFRKWPEREHGGIIAIFPEEASDFSPYPCLMYEHVGQYGGGSPERVIQGTTPATPSEYADLKKELEDKGYKLQVIQRYRRSFLEARKKTAEGLRREPDYHDNEEKAT